MSRCHVEQITFHFKGREVFVIPAESSWEQFGCPKELLLEPEFLDRLWQLLDEFELLEK
jgi:hypothetical protein